jgi:hypothetical protein
MDEFKNEMPTYDTVVGTIMSNVIVERQRCGKIILWDFQEDNDWDRLYFNVATIVADMNKEPIYLQMPFWEYVKMKWKRRKQRKNLRYLSRSRAEDIPCESRTSVYIIMDFIRDFYNLDKDYFGKINSEYYGWV